MLVRFGLTGAQRRGDVPGNLLALSLGMLGGHAADITGTCQIGHRRAVAAGVNIPGTWHLAPGTWHLAPGTDMNSSTTSRPRLVPRSRPSTSGSGRTPTHQTRDQVGPCSPVDKTTRPRLASVTDWPVRTSMPRLRRDAVGGNR
jgi:hypothetical protein